MLCKQFACQQQCEAGVSGYQRNLLSDIQYVLMRRKLANGIHMDGLWLVEFHCAGRRNSIRAVPGLGAATTCSMRA